MASENTNDLAQFAEELQSKSLDEKKKELIKKHKELEKTERRIAEIDRLFGRLYEDNVSGKITDERFATLSHSYEAEHAEKRQLAETMKKELSEATEQTDGIEKFIEAVKSVTEPTELTAELVHRFISKIVVHEAKKLDGKRHQDIDIYYTGVGILFSQNPEEVEQLFEEHIKETKSTPVANEILTDV